MKKNSQPENKIKTFQMDLSNQVVGRAATKVANILRGKNKVSFAPNLLMGDKVIAYNSTKMVLTGKKSQQKVYYRHSGYLGHLKKITTEALLKKNPSEVFRKAVTGMLPKNRLKRYWLKNLVIYEGGINE